MLDFPNVSSSAAARTGVDGVFVKNVRVALNSREPLVTRVVMEIAPTATYHVERTGPDGRDLAVVFEGRKAGGAVLVAPPTARRRPRGQGRGRHDHAGAGDRQRRGADAAGSDDGADCARRQSAAPAADVPRPPKRAASAATAARAAARSTGPGKQPPAQQPPPPPPPPQPPAQPPQTQPTFSTDVPGTGQKQYTGHPINFDFEDADLRAVLRVFADESGLNMIIDPQVQGRVNVLLNDVPWDQALDQILRVEQARLHRRRQHHPHRAAGGPRRRAGAAQKLVEAKALAGELRVQTFTLSYAKADALSPLLTKSVLSTRGQIQVDARTNTLIITDLPDRLQTAQQLIGTLDRPQPQVEVEARVVQTTRDFARALGIQWGFNGRANSTIGNTTGLAFPNNGIDRRPRSAARRARPIRAAAPSTTATAVNLPVAAPRRRSGWRSDRSTARSTSTSR